MPIEIKELHIRVAVTTSPAPLPSAGGGAERDAIVSECIEQVIHILQNKAER